MKRPLSSAPERLRGSGPLATLLAALLLAGGLLARGWWTPPVRAAHSSGSAVAPACVPQSAVAATTPALQAAAHITLYVEPHDGKRVVSRAILRARHSILLQMYLLTDRTLLHDLERAAARGVAVNVILERRPYTSSGDNPNLYAYNNLLAAELPTRWSAPAFALTHAKTMVVDGQAAYIMTTNYTRAAFRSNREFVVVDREGQDVRQVRDVFWADWRGQPLAPYDARTPISPSTARPLLSRLVSSAMASIDVYAEEFQDPKMACLLANQAGRGRRVRVLLPAASAGSEAREGPLIALLTRAGGRVRRMPPHGLDIHAKAIVADGRTAFVGSENLSAASLDRNREVGLLLSDPVAVRRLLATFQTDWASARVVPGSR